MRRLISAHSPGSEATELLLHVVEQFDDLLIAGAGLETLTCAAGEMLQAEVFALDALNDRFAAASPHSPAVGDPAIGHALLRHSVTERAGLREVARHTVGDEDVVAASLEHGRGRLGVVWTRKLESDWTDGDELVLERFAQAASIAIQQHQRARAGRWRAGDPTALELVVDGGLDATSTVEAVRAANLNAKLKYVALAMSLDPPGIVSDAVATAVVGRALDRRRAAWRAVTVMNALLVVSTSEAAHESALSTAVEEAAQSGWRLAIGVGNAVPPDQLNRSAVQAREALVVGSTGEEGGVTCFSSLGALHLLASIPGSALNDDRDLAAVASLTESRSGRSDLALLVAYCETGSLRQTGKRLYLHHSSVEYRLRRIEETLGFSLGTPQGRFRALLAATLVGMSRAVDIA